MKLAVVILGLVGVLALSTVVRAQGSASERFPKDVEEFDKMFKDLNNWGRWGKGDSLGTINLVTAAKKKQALALAKEGINISLAHNLSTEEALDNPRPLVLTLGPTFKTDTQLYNYHGTFVTHIDAICHQTQHDMLFNGVPATVSNAQGCKPGIDNLKNGVLTRGILIDIPRLRGVPYLDPPTAIYPEEVEQWEKKTRLKIGPGDAIFLRYGRWVRRAKLGPWKALGNAAGFHPSMGPWLKARDVALVAAENTAEAQTEEPYLTKGVQMPLHVFLVAGLGMPIIDDVDLDAVAETAARLNRWEFLVMIAPLSVPGGTGGPVNPIAIF